MRSTTSTLDVIHSSEPAAYMYKYVHFDGDGSDVESRAGDPEKKPDNSQPSTSTGTVTAKKNKRGRDGGMMDEVILELVKNTRERSSKLDEEIQAPPVNTINTYTTWLASELRDLPEASIECFQQRCTMLL